MWSFLALQKIDVGKYGPITNPKLLTFLGDLWPRGRRWGCIRQTQNLTSPWGLLSSPSGWWPDNAAFCRSYAWDFICKGHLFSPDLPWNPLDLLYCSSRLHNRGWEDINNSRGCRTRTKMNFTETFLCLSCISSFPGVCKLIFTPSHEMYFIPTLLMRNPKWVTFCQRGG